MNLCDIDLSFSDPYFVGYFLYLLLIYNLMKKKKKNIEEVRSVFAIINMARVKFVSIGCFSIFLKDFLIDLETSHLKTKILK